MKTVLNQDEIRKLMEQNEDDVYTLANRMEVAPSTIYRILNGDRGVGSDLLANLI
ncbi:helix-turn-helix domain-containing protein [Candidatus Enterococcus clewellii]|uniref:Resolvase HTH domain-containing protein n=1 Tax=Candidatus Enterococcus clewellii TaxID=1834193 RepID=A0A242KA87_9ENTE|nr:helix-turn-helix domain-containing protein [Enterococcus sp. 9E7_DIV0242]OTP17460.1 hypothetical protein A5888_001598 [Enterococcus sp. 9E7_DIV0242]